VRTQAPQPSRLQGHRHCNGDSDQDGEGEGDQEAQTGSNQDGHNHGSVDVAFSGRCRVTIAPPGYSPCLPPLWTMTVAVAQATDPSTHRTLRVTSSDLCDLDRDGDGKYANGHDQDADLVGSGSSRRTPIMTVQGTIPR
jgi:hypothetical protein